MEKLVEKERKKALYWWNYYKFYRSVDGVKSNKCLDLADKATFRVAISNGWFDDDLLASDKVNRIRKRKFVSKEIKESLPELLKNYSVGELSTKLGFSYMTIYYWAEKLKRI